MTIKIALAGNPNCGKTTMFNALTGANQFVGNWPGVTVEKKEGRLRGHKDVVITDLPGIYSLSPYTLEEVVARNYLLQERPDAILNLVDGSNIERNLYLTTQLLELGIPVVVALNMIDVVRKRGDKIDLDRLSDALGCPVVETSAIKGEGCVAAAERAAELVMRGASTPPKHTFRDDVERALGEIEGLVEGAVPAENSRWYAVKLFERDEKVWEKFTMDAALRSRLEEIIRTCEEAEDDDAESIITNERYGYIAGLVDRCVKKKRAGLSVSDRVDRIVTNRWLALPIFVVIMWAVYWVSMGPFGTFLTDWTNDVFAAEWLQGGIGGLLASAGVNEVLTGLIVDGIVGGVGAVLGFVPQMLVLFLMLCVLEDIGYMARIAFIMDRIFRRFGLSGKSFIPMLIGTGCGVPGVMASRTIEQDRDRKMTIMTTCFIPCGAKMPIVGLIAGALFGGSGLVAVSAYFVGVAAVVVSGVMLKKLKAFAGEPAPFVMELPAYHVPNYGNVLRGTWERGWSFIKRAGTVILISSIVLWFLQGFGFVDGVFQMVEDNNHSLLASIGGAIDVIFAPLGFGTWKPAVAVFTGLIAKEEVVSTFAVLFNYAGELSEAGDEIWAMLRDPALGGFTSAVAAYSFMVFNLLCAPCFAAMGAIKREMNNPRWTLAAIGYMCGFAYLVSLIIYQVGGLFTGDVPFGAGTVVGFIALAGIVWMLVRRGWQGEGQRLRAVDAVHA